MTGRVSKQRACSNCVRTKSKCSFAQPICRRCLLRNEPCEYPKLTLVTNRRRVNCSSASGEAAEDHKSSGQRTPPARVEETGRNTINTSFSLPPLDISRMESSELGGNLDTSLIDQSSWLSLNKNTPSTYSPTSSINSMFISSHTPLKSSDVGVMTQQDMMQTFQGQLSSNPYRYRDPSNDILNQRHLIINENTNFTLIDDIAHSQSLSEAFESHMLRDVLAIGNTSTNSREMTDYLHNQPSTLSSICPQISTGSLTSNFNYGTLLRILKNYVNLLQSDGYCTPFIHPEIYRGTHQHLSSLQKSSMAACSAAALSNRRSKQFAKKATVAERERLVQDFHLYSCLQEWDALHAMCIYQITDLIDIHEEINWKSGVSLHIPFLLKMTHRFRHNHSEKPPKNAHLPDTPDVDWLAWTIEETVLRTIFLVNFINEATGHLHDVVSPYYEPLDHDGFLNMALPAPRGMWEATTAKEWRIQKERCGWVDGKVTVKLILEAEDRNFNGYGGGVPGVGDSKELAHLVIACGLLARGSR